MSEKKEPEKTDLSPPTTEGGTYAKQTEKYTQSLQVSSKRFGHEQRGSVDPWRYERYPTRQPMSLISTRGHSGVVVLSWHTFFARRRNAQVSQATVSSLVVRVSV